MTRPAARTRHSTTQLDVLDELDELDDEALAAEAAAQEFALTEEVFVQDAVDEGLNDVEFEQTLFGSILDGLSHFDDDDAKVRHAEFCIQCIEKGRPDLFYSHTLDACMEVTADINSPHGSIKLDALLCLHWPPKRPSSSTTKSKGKAPQLPFGTTMDKGNQSISFINRLLPDTDSRSMMLDLYTQR